MAARTIDFNRVPPSGSISADDAAAILDGNGGSDLITHVMPPVVVLQEPGERPLIVERETTNPPPLVQTVTVPAAGAGTAAGLMAWAKANPLPALAIAGLAVYVIYKVTKPSK